MVSDDRPTAQRFVEHLDAVATDAERVKLQRYFKSGEGEYGEGDEFIGVRMGSVFALAEEFRAMPLDEIEVLLESPVHEARAGAVKIMAKQAAARTATDDDRRGPRRPVPPPDRPDQQLGPGRPRCLGRRRSLPGRQAAGSAR